MLKRRVLSKAQSMAEYAVIIAAVAAALAALGIFFRAGLQNRIFGLAHELSDRPYWPRATVSNSRGEANTVVQENYADGVTTIIYDEDSNRHGQDVVSPDP